MQTYCCDSYSCIMWHRTTRGGSKIFYMGKRTHVMQDVFRRKRTHAFCFQINNFKLEYTDKKLQISRAMKVLATKVPIRHSK